MATPKLLHIESIQTVTPGRMTEPGRSRRISVAGPLGPDILRSRLRVVLYYEKASQESPSVLAAWIKESLSVALPDEPGLAGRLRRDSEGDGRWEIKSNDAGVRLVHASAEMTMPEFLGSEARDGGEAQLAYWMDVDEEEPHFSPLLYMQLTQFLDDGYAIGISCSVLLADPWLLARFLKSWVQTHARMLAHGQLSERPLFHPSYFRRPDRPRIRSTPLVSAPTNPAATTTMLFKVARAQRRRSSPACDELAALCLDEAKQRIEGTAMAASNFSLVINDHEGDLKVESCDARRGLARSEETFGGAFSEVRWEEELVGIGDMALSEGNSPVHASYHVVSSTDEPLVTVTLPSDDEGSSDLIIITAAIPKKSLSCPR